MTRYLLAIAIFAAAFTLTACASNRDMFGHNDGVDQNTNAAMVGALNGMGR
jgi:hypothetical protein